uniref:Lysosomal dipeptide transporter MFSD1 n=1 Tax=Paramoeba aestuarina TaxID=180227 RepID=A0A7S4N5T0_9EUKA
MGKGKKNSINEDDGDWIEETDLGEEDKKEGGVLPWLILVCVCFITFGSYWCFDTPGAIYKQLRLWFGPETYNQQKNLLLYSVYSYPNVILAFFGGFIIDRVTGVRLGAILFCSLVLAGQTVFALGVQTRQYWLAVTGRFIFGLGGESLTVAQNTFCARWAPEGMLALWFGIVVSCSRIGSSINFIVTPKLAAIGVPVSVWAGVGTCILSMCACIGAASLDFYGRDRIKEDKSAAPPQLKGVLEFKPPVWVLFVTCVFFYGAVLTFYTVASNIMQNTGYLYSAQVASALLAIPNVVAIVGCPYFGWFVDQHGRALAFIIVASLMLMITHLGFLGNALDFWLIDPIPLLVWMGIAYSLGAASMWPIVSVAVPPKLVGTAYGAMCSIQNLGLAVFPQIVGAIGDSNPGTRGYALQLVFFVFVALLSAILSFGNIFLDKKFINGKMNASGEELQRINARLAAEKGDEDTLLFDDDEV